VSRDQTDELYELPPGEFVEARNRIAGELKKAGNKEAATAVKAMIKPTASVWAINHVARHEPAAMRKFLEVSDELREAQTRGGGGDDGRRTFQELQAKQREALDRVVDLAMASVREAGLGDSRTVLDRVANDLRWGALSDETRARLADGRLAQDVAPPDFGAMLGLAGGAAPMARPEPKKTDKPPAKAAREERDREEEAAKREQARFLRASLNAAQAQEARARTLATRAHQARERAERALDAAREDLARKEAEAAEAARTHAEADEAADTHGKEVTRLTKELSKLEN
jgi:hypothetical protein